MNSAPEETAAPPRIAARTWWVCAVTGAGAFMAMLDSTVANLALAAIRADLDATLTSVQWVATAYLVALAVSLPAAAWLGNRFGHGRAWAYSLAAFAIGSGLCAVSPDVAWLIAARVVQGLAAGIMVPAGQAVIATVAGPRRLGRIMGALGLAVSLGPALGPAFGGLLLDVASWPWLFWVNVPIGVASLIAARRLVPAGARDTTRRLDVRGLVFLGLGLPLVLYGAAETGTTGATITTVASIGLGAALAVGFVLSSKRSAQPLIDLTVLRHRGFSSATATCALTGANMYGGLLLLPLYLQDTGGHTATETGLLLLAMGLGTAIALYVAGWLTDRRGPGMVCVIGAGLLIASTVPFLFTETRSVTTLVPVLVVRGIGLAWAQMPAVTAAYTAVSTDRIGDATTIVNIAQRVGGAIAAVGVVIVVTHTPGYVYAFTTLAVISVATVAFAVRLRGRSRPA